MSEQTAAARGRTEMTIIGAEDEYTPDGTAVAILSDTENERAWIQSDVTIDIEE